MLHKIAAISHISQRKLLQTETVKNFDEA